MGVKNTAREFISRHLLLNPGADLGDDEDLLLSGIVDSLGVMRLLTHLETTYGLSIPPEDVVIENFQTLNAMSAYLAGRGVR